MPTDPGDEERSGGEQEFVDRRSGKDRRSGRERRRGGRRHRSLGVEEDRRSGKDRRQGPRRSEMDRRIFADPRYRPPRRRHEGPAVYSAEEAARVQRMLSRIGHGASCPVCGGRFMLGPVDRRGLESVRQATCADCGRGTVVTNCVLARVMVLSRVDAVSAVLRVVLTGAGHEVIEPPHSGAALDLYRENPVDVVIMDESGLAEMGGQEFIRRLRAEFSDPRVVVLAPRQAYGKADASAAAMQLGATLVVRVPFSRDDILRALKEARQ